MCFETAVRSCVIASPGLEWLKIPVPETMIFAPFSATSPTFSHFMPPSTCSGSKGNLSRRRRSFSKTSGLNFWPPNPGS